MNIKNSTAQFESNIKLNIKEAKIDNGSISSADLKMDQEELENLDKYKDRSGFSSKKRDKQNKKDHYKEQTAKYQETEKKQEKDINKLLNII